VILALLLLPALAGTAAFFVKGDRTRRALLVCVALAHLALVGAAWIVRPPPLVAGWVGLDAAGLVVLTLASALFCAAALYAVGYLEREGVGPRAEFDEGFLFTNAPEAVFTGGLLWLLATLSLVAASRHLGILWVAIEATTLSSAPLLYFHRHARSLEATWKYLLLCSVGIGIALLGNFSLALAAQAAQAVPGSADGGVSPLALDAWLAHPGALDPTWTRVAFLCLLVGFGTKMGLAPMHAWLPDAHSEAPSLVSALLSGALLNAAFLGILRALQVLGAAGPDGAAGAAGAAGAEHLAFASPLLIGFGLASLAFAAVFILGQGNYKRMLAWSSVEHMGLLAVAIGVGGGGIGAALLHAVNHSLTKGMLFLLAGNILHAYRSRATRDVTGLLRTLPVTGTLWGMGLLAITGTPPFGPFVSEFAILRACFAQGHAAVGVATLSLLAVVFLGMARALLRMTQGPVPAERTRADAVPAERAGAAAVPAESWWAVAPPALLATFVIGLGVYVPPVVQHALREAAALLGGR
jgi:hydrogenase-4 component F